MAAPIELSPSPWRPAILTAAWRWRAVGLLVICLPAARTGAGEAAPRPRVLIFAIDGCRPDALLAADAPHLDGLRETGAFSLAGMTSEVPISGPGWSSALTGVWSDKHGVVDNSFAGARFDLYPTFFCRLRDARPEVLIASYIRWGPLGTDLIRCADVSQSPASDAAGADAAVSLLGTQDPDVIFLHLNAPDSAGHSVGFSPTSAGYLDAIESVDANVGRVLAALHGRPGFAAEEWLVVATTDHGGSGNDHHDNIPENRTIFLFAAGERVIAEEILPAPGIVDVAASALVYLGLSLDPAWDLDGRPVRLRTAEPEANQLPGDCDQDARLGLADAVCMLRDLFLGVTPPVECDAEPRAAVLDANGDAGNDVSDPVYLLLHLFAGGPPPAAGTECILLGGCEPACAAAPP